jgi:hypothetical protein
MIVCQQIMRSHQVTWAASNGLHIAKQPVIQPIAKSALASELATAQPFCVSKGLTVYLLTADQAPHVMQEIGRIREIGFRSKGGGTGKAADIDHFDTGLFPYQQLVVWDTQHQEIVSACRCQAGDAIAHLPTLPLASGELFHFSKQFQHEYLPYAIELGRLVVNQTAKRNHVGIFAFWSGLAKLAHDSKFRYFFGKVTVFPTYNHSALDLLLKFLEFYHRDKTKLIYPHPILQFGSSPPLTESTSPFTKIDWDQDFHLLRQRLAILGESFPPMLRSYLTIAHDMKYYGAAHNVDFGGVVEIAILVSLGSIHSSTLVRYMI